MKTPRFEVPNKDQFQRIALLETAAVTAEDRLAIARLAELAQKRSPVVRASVSRLLTLLVQSLLRTRTQLEFPCTLAVAKSKSGPPAVFVCTDLRVRHYMGAGGITIELQGLSLATGGAPSLHVGVRLFAPGLVNAGVGLSVRSLAGEWAPVADVDLTATGWPSAVEADPVCAGLFQQLQAVRQWAAALEAGEALPRHVGLTEVLTLEQASDAQGNILGVAPQLLRAAASTWQSAFTSEQLARALGCSVFRASQVASSLAVAGWVTTGLSDGVYEAQAGWRELAGLEA